ncbi:carbon storage regulator CsrA [Bacillus fonticola]|uniref:carbon storage regulator CsrA n=1 Tax=Bacillus fonticola TaxID=2728853 RepID=UPI00147435A7|nr:carbon storage regulator CsrA [Bacillus fonticola]
MLVLTRKQGETLCIGDDIEIEIISLKNDQVKIGIRAPKSVDIVRKELLADTAAANAEAVGGTVDVRKLLSGGKQGE